MKRQILQLMALSLGWSMAARVCSAAPVQHPRLDKVLQQLQAASTAEQYTQIAAAVDASPALSAQLEALAGAGKLTGITLAQPAELKAPGPFLAYVSGTKLVMSTALLPQLAPHRIYDVVRPDDILPNNLVFVLGHLAFHLGRVEAMAAAHADVQRQIAQLTSSPGAHDYTAIASRGVQARIDDEARADIVGWNDVVNAVIHGNAGRLPTAGQYSSLLMNFRYRGFIFKSLHAPDHIHMADDATIALDAANVTALAATIATSTLADIE